MRRAHRGSGRLLRHSSRPLPAQRRPLRSLRQQALLSPGYAWVFPANTAPRNPVPRNKRDSCWEHKPFGFHKAGAGRDTALPEEIRRQPDQDCHGVAVKPWGWSSLDECASSGNKALLCLLFFARGNSCKALRNSSNVVFNLQRRDSNWIRLASGGSVMSDAKIRNMEEFASLSGISRPTVSKYFNDPDSVRQSDHADADRAGIGALRLPSKHFRGQPEPQA
jgi:hypothetical protein